MDGEGERWQRDKANLTGCVTKFVGLSPEANTYTPIPTVNSGLTETLTLRIHVMTGFYDSLNDRPYDDRMM